MHGSHILNTIAEIPQTHAANTWKTDEKYERKAEDNNENCRAGTLVAVLKKA
jgi:hypothetical protein